MNITELARILRISPQELRDMLPELGFAIGQKAIKVDNNTAKKIMKDWPFLRREWEQKKMAAAIKKQDEVLPKEKKTIFVPKVLAVRAYAELAGIPVNRVLAELMKNGVFTSINEKIDFDTAMIIGENLNLDVQLAESKVEEDDKEDKKLEAILAKEEFGGEVHTYSPAFKDEEIDEIISISNHLVFNSFSQLKRFKDKAYGKLPNSNKLLNVS